MTDQYLVPKAQVIVEEEIKHSRFISFLFQCQTEQEFKCALTNIKQDYPGASHYCSAFVWGTPWNDVATGSSDDGEPAGSAGRPMLVILQGSQMGEIAAVVVRYYGGTKLGVGGLVRAYTSGLRVGLNQLETCIKQIRHPGTLYCDYHHLRDVEHLLGQHDAVIEDKVFTEGINITFAIPEKHQQGLNLALASVSQGLVQAKF